jgi:hypothetical protein
MPDPSRRRVETDPSIGQSQWDEASTRDAPGRVMDYDDSSWTWHYLMPLPQHSNDSRRTEISIPFSYESP